MNEIIKNGAQWWKFDFHTHTPASNDFGKGPNQRNLQQISPHEWLLAYMKAEIDCVAITDHNSGEWIDKLQSELEKMKEEKPEGFRSIYLFPGVEITVHNGIHVLAIFDVDEGTSKINDLIARIKFQGDKGDSNGVTQFSFDDVVSEITSLGGIAIPAHVDKPAGLFEKISNGPTLESNLDCKDVFAIELIDKSYSLPHIYRQKRHDFAEVLGSDSHHLDSKEGPQFPGSHYTCVKMEKPDLDGLKLSLLDGSNLAILRVDEKDIDPNTYSSKLIESIKVDNARYIGRGDPLELTFNPWLNTLIGGRGTGKSSLIEFLRIGINRFDELPNLLADEFEKYKKVYQTRRDDGLLNNDTTIKVTYQKYGQRYLLMYNSKDRSIQAFEQGDEDWSPIEGDLKQRFPVMIYSQKQIFQMANRPLSLLRIADQAIEKNKYDEDVKKEENNYLTTKSKIRELETEISKEKNLRGELDDIQKKLNTYDEANFSNTLKQYQQLRKQENSIEKWESEFQDKPSLLQDLAESLVPNALDESNFDLSDDVDKDIVNKTQEVNRQYEEVKKALFEIASKLETINNQWFYEKENSDWNNRKVKGYQDYENVKEKLSDVGVAEGDNYEELVGKKEDIESRLSEIEEKKKEVEKLKQDAEGAFQRVLSLKEKLTQERRNFLNQTLSGNKYVRINVKPFLEKEEAEEGLRKTLQIDDGRFERDIGKWDEGGLLGKLFENNDPQTLKRNLSKIKIGLRSPKEWSDWNFDKRFINHLEKLNPEVFDRLDLWFPEDTLEVEYSTKGDGTSFQSIEHGSPGQKTAALLAFLLSYGSDPLILDQPEDDLDNHLIYDLIVSQLREGKKQRQIIVVTHNANIVVNGDAELIAELGVGKGRTNIENIGSLQNPKVREAICNVMEGGIEAFERRYKRIAVDQIN